MRGILFWAGLSATLLAQESVERVPLDAAGHYAVVYRNHPLAARNDRVVRGLVVIHGQGRNADNYFASSMAAAYLAGGMEDTVVVSPRLASNEGRQCQDKLEPMEANFRCTGDSWRSGAPSLTDAQINSYDVTDAILRLMAKKDVFPNLRSIVVTGHSAGGQYVARYAMASKADETLGVAVHYIVANPSSYAYFDDRRLAPGSACSEKGECKGEFVTFAEGRNCTTYDRWPYGMQNRASGASAGQSVEDMKKRLAGRKVTYLLGELDTLPLAGFDSSCPAMAQGPNRLQRGINYWNYANKILGAQHRILVVPLCGHNARCMYTADAALPLLFAKP
jgi:hypothetical protein